MYEDYGHFSASSPGKTLLKAFGSFDREWFEKIRDELEKIEPDREAVEKLKPAFARYPKWFNIKGDGVAASQSSAS